MIPTALPQVRHDNARGKGDGWQIFIVKRRRGDMRGQKGRLSSQLDLRWESGFVNSILVKGDGPSALAVE